MWYLIGTDVNGYYFLILFASIEFHVIAKCAYTKECYVSKYLIKGYIKR